jgi:polyisoprenoid-binding protein YceI
MKRMALPLVLAILALPAAAAPLAVDYSKSEIAFASKQMGVPVDGRVRKFAMQLDFDAKKPEAGSVKIELDAATIDAGSDEANVELVKRGWMDAAKFPKVTFASTSVRALAGGRFEVTGKMSIKGITRDITAPFTAKPQGGAQLFEGAFVLKRLEFKIGEGPWSDTETVADEVQIRFKVLASPAPK